MKILKQMMISLVFCSLIFTVGNTFAQKDYAPGVSDIEIKIGNTNPYSGPASSYSTIGKAIKAYFDKVNAEGGINGRKINFISLDDGYSPPKTKEQFRKLIEKEEVFAIFQSLGTPTNSAVHRYINRKQVPHLFLATGAAKWADPENFPWTIGFQPDYQVEGAIFGSYLLQNHSNGKIAILYQNDDYGKDYVTGLKNGLGDKAESMIIAKESYEVTDPSIDSQIIKLKASGADIFYNVTIPKFSVQAIKKIYELQWKPVHLFNSVSNSIAGVLKPVGFEKSQGIISTRYLLDPNDPEHAQHEDILDWQEFMAQYYSNGDRKSPFNLYGYAVAQTLVHVLEKCGDNLTRENLMKQATNIKNLRVRGLSPGILITTTPTDYRPIESMELIQFKGDGYISLSGVIKGGNDLNL